MELYDIYRLIFIGGAVACGVMLVVSAVLFFVLKIPKVVSDLTGRTARKAIENIRMQNEQTGDKTYQSSAVNLERGKITDKITRSGRLEPRDPTPFGTGVITEKISTQELVEEAGETTLLGEEAGETTLLMESGETTVLDAQYADYVQPDQTFVLEFEITMIHTEEVIA